MSGRITWRSWPGYESGDAGAALREILAQAHRDQGLKCRRGPTWSLATMKGIRRQHGTRQRAVKPITRDDAAGDAGVLDQQKSHLKAARDRALLLVGFAGAFRRAELVACGWRT